jgi:hypothetical protein
VVVNAFPDMEKKLWERNSHATDAQAMAGLRDRFTFLLTTHGVLRGESLFKAELSDMLHLIHEGRDPTPIGILILQIATGKTNQAGKLYGRILRHCDPALCGIGGLGFYLLQRFKVTGEMTPPPDFTVNKNWFDIQLLVGVNTTRSTNTKSISDRGYAGVIKNISKTLQLPVHHFTHLGRELGPTMLEFAEMDPEDIRRLGNWDPSTQEAAYSAKLPLKPMRVAVGFHEQKGLHWSARQMKIPAETLQQQLWSWIEDSLQAINTATSADQIDRYTAIGFLKLLKFLRIVILQDAAMLLHQGRTHIVLEDPIFSSPAFLNFKAEIVQHCQEATNPCDTNLNQLIPGMNERLGNLQSSVSVGFQQSDAKMQAGFLLLQQAMTGNNARFAAGLRYAACAFSPPSNATDSPNATDFASAFPLTAGGVATVAAASAVQPSPSRTREPGISLHKKHDSVTSMYNEWHGIGAEFLNKPSTGGLCALESQGMAWRSHFKHSEKAQFSRFKGVMHAVARWRQEKGKEIVAVLAEFDGIMAEQGVGNLSNLVKALQSKGYLPKKTRGPRTSRAISPTESL